MNNEQKGFFHRLLLVFGPVLLGLVLTAVADLGQGQEQNPSQMTQLSGISLAAGLLFLFSSITSITTLRYGSRHKTRICETPGFGYLLLGYRILFWASIAASLIASALLVWIVLHIGPVR